MINFTWEKSSLYVCQIRLLKKILHLVKLMIFKYLMSIVHWFESKSGYVV